MFEFATAQRIVFGRGSRTRLVDLARELGHRPVLVTGRLRADTQALVERVEEAFGPCPRLECQGEPQVSFIVEQVARVRPLQRDFVIAVGGGSALDAGKAMAALLPNTGSPLDYLEVIGRGLPLHNPALPLLAVPTTAGTGAEATKNAVLGDTQRGVKVSLRHLSMLPRVALVDSELTWSVPPDVTAATGMDALTQCLEPYVSRAATPLTDALCRTGLQLASAVRKAYVAGSDAQARDELALMSLCGGMALANAKLGAVHGFAAPLGGMFPAPHGAVCARLLPLVVRANLQALQTRTDVNAQPTLARFTHVARWITGNPNAAAQDSVPWLEALCRELQIPALSAYGMRAEHIALVVQKAERASSMQGNPSVLTAAELGHILEQAL